jgi:hypothetical protein
LFGVGGRAWRKEDDAPDPRQGRYTDDFSPQPAMHALVLRSPQRCRNSPSTSQGARAARGRADPDGG